MTDAQAGLFCFSVVCASLNLFISHLFADQRTKIP